MAGAQAHSASSLPSVQKGFFRGLKIFPPARMPSDLKVPTFISDGENFFSWRLPSASPEGQLIGDQSFDMTHDSFRVNALMGKLLPQTSTSFSVSTQVGIFWC